jgi:predicted transposase YbfD/YdcC
VPATVTEVCDDLLKLFGSVSDGRSGQGRVHPVAAVLALAAAAVVAGMKGYTAIAGWVKDVPPPVLADLYLRAGAGPAPPPSRATTWRVVTDADAEVFDATVGSWLMSNLLAEPVGQGGAADADRDDPVGLMPVRLDGKTVRGAKDAAGNQRHLLAALVGRTAQSSVVAAQAEVGVKTNEVPMAEVVLGQVDLNGKLVTADALHTVKATADFICEAGGEFVLPVKENRKALFDALDGLPWHQVPIAHSATDRGHGRITTRTIQVLSAPEDLPFPHVSQVLLIERYVSDLDGSPVSAVAALGVASPPPPTGPVPPTWPATCANTGRSRHCIGCATPFIKKTNPRSEPDQGPESWQRYATWPSAPCAYSDAPTSPKPPDGPAGLWTGHSPSSASPHLETEVGRDGTSWPARCSGTIQCRFPVPTGQLPESPASSHARDSAGTSPSLWLTSRSQGTRVRSCLPRSPPTAGSFRWRRQLHGRGGVREGRTARSSIGPTRAIAPSRPR